MFSSKDLFFTPAASGAYTVSKSLRFRASATAYLTRTFGTPTSQNIWTYSCWVKRGALGADYNFGPSATGLNCQIYFSSANTLDFYYSGAYVFQTTQVFRDPSAFYHIVLAFNGAASGSSKLLLYVNGVQVTAFSTDNRSTFTTSIINTAIIHGIGRYQNAGANYLDGYLAETYFIDGSQKAATDFGAYDTNGIWQPAAYTGSYGNNGFYLKFTDVGATSGSNTGYGKDFAGTNYWTTNNFGTASTDTTYDSMLDSPTNATGDIGNYCVISPINSYSSITISNANLTATLTEAAYRKSVSTMAFPTSGKYYVEAKLTGINYASFGVVTPTAPLNDRVGATATGYGVVTGGTQWDKWDNGTSTGNFWSISTTSPTLQIAIDTTNGKLWIGYNDTWLDGSGGLTGNPAAGTNATFTIDTSRVYLPAVGGYKSDSIAFDFTAGQRPFTYTPPSGYSALNTQNLTTPTITNGAQYMAATLWTGNGTARAISNGTNNTIGTTFQSDFVWVKSRTQAIAHRLVDVVRGATLTLSSNLTNAEYTDSQGVTAFNSTGFNIGTDTSYNNTGDTYVGWNWKAGGASVVNNVGTIQSNVSANTTAGFSVVTGVSTGASGSISVGHGLGVTPSMVIFKNRDLADDWYTWHTSLGASTSGYNLKLDTTAAVATNANIWGGAGYGMTSTTIGLGQGNLFSASNQKFVCYAFAAVASYSAFGSYTGNGSTDGPFIYTGFRPRWVMIKRYDTGSAEIWSIVDTTRDTYNTAQNYLSPNTSGAEASYAAWSILSNGFKIVNTGTALNASGGTYIYAAFAETPFKYSRAR